MEGDQKSMNFQDIFIQNMNIEICEKSQSLANVFAREILSEIYNESAYNYNINIVIIPRDWGVPRSPSSAQKPSERMGSIHLVSEIANGKKYLQSYPKIANEDLEIAQRLLVLFFRRGFPKNTRKVLDQITEYFDERYWEWKKSSSLPDEFYSD